MGLKREGITRRCMSLYGATPMAWSLVNEMPLSDWTFTFNRSGRDRKFKAKGPGVDRTLALLCALAPEEPKYRSGT